MVFIVLLPLPEVLDDVSPIGGILYLGIMVFWFGFTGIWGFGKDMYISYKVESMNPKIVRNALENTKFPDKYDSKELPVRIVKHFIK